MIRPFTSLEDPVGQSSCSDKSAGTDTSTTLTGLYANTLYRVKVKATDDEGPDPGPTAPAEAPGSAPSGPPDPAPSTGTDETTGDDPPPPASTSTGSDSKTGPSSGK